MNNHIQTLKEIQEEARRNKKSAPTRGHYVGYSAVINLIDEILQAIEYHNL
jgi:hypothetical protein